MDLFILLSAERAFLDLMDSATKNKRRHFNLLRQGGFSLIEFLTTIAIMGIMFIIAVPSFREMQASMDRGRAIRQFEADIRKIQGIALSRGLRAIIVLDGSGSFYSIGLDYAPYSDTGVPDEIISRAAFPANVSLSVGDSIIFDSRGYLIDTDGNFSSTAIEMRQNGESFLSGNIPSNGFISFDPRE